MFKYFFVIVTLFTLACSMPSSTLTIAELTQSNTIYTAAKVSKHNDLIVGEDGQVIDGMVRYEQDNFIALITIKAGTQNGPTYIFADDGKLVEQSNFENGKFSGKRTFYYTDGYVSKEENYKNDILDGEFKEYNRDGHGFSSNGVSRIDYSKPYVALTGKYVNGKLNGLVRSYDSGGDYKKITPYVDGVIHGEERSFIGGKERIFTPYVNGKKQGIQRTYYDDCETLLAGLPYVDDMKQGINKEYSKGGNVIAETVYENDQQVGPIIGYFENGDKRLIIFDEKNGYCVDNSGNKTRDFNADENRYNSSGKIAYACGYNQYK